VFQYYHETATARPFGDRGLAILRLLLPALIAGVEACRRLFDQRSTLALPSARELRTIVGRYRICGTFLPAGLTGPSAMILVTCCRVGAEAVSDTTLSARYGLTPRQVQVVRLAMTGISTADLACTLGISAHTARHHLEVIRAKVGKHRIGEVLAAIAAR
jgi:DNA-binding CsgD family transcriptional regulator